MKYRIRGFDEAEMMFVYWSNTLGWTSLIESDTFNVDEREMSALPMGGTWVEAEDEELLDG